MKIPFSPPDITQAEVEAVTKTLTSGWITTGPKTKLFEKNLAEYCKTNRVACLNSATAALELTLRILGIGEGDEVITTAYTYTASASVIAHVGAKIVFADVGKDSFFIDYEALEGLITPRTKAIIAVDIAGVMCDYEKIQEIVSQKSCVFLPVSDLQKKMGRIAIIADAAHSFGAIRHEKISGQAADFTCFSFHAVKNLTTGEGGAVTWKSINDVEDEFLYKQYMLFSLHGQSKDALEKSSINGWEYDIMIPGYKCNMTDICASIGIVQLSRYHKLLQRRHELVAQYSEQLKNAPVTFLKHTGVDFTSSAHLMLVRLTGKNQEQRNRVIQKLAEVGIATNVHYKPLPLHTAYKNMGFCICDFPNSLAMYENQITLPLYSTMTDEQAAYVSKNLIDVI
ncbi:MAG: DegT/DnrJ/EryC1/StrS family aminotransferase [Christensenellaceae bacterium]